MAYKTWPRPNQNRLISNVGALEKAKSIEAEGGWYQSKKKKKKINPLGEIMSECKENEQGGGRKKKKVLYNKIHVKHQPREFEIYIRSRESRPF